MQESRFYAYISRMKHIFRWSLMKNSQEESLSVHTLDTAVIAHCLGLLRNRRFGGSCDAQRLVMLAIYHDCSEILTGDMPTPIKYYNPEIKEAYKKVEVIANQKLLAMLPQDLRADYEPLFIHEGEDPELLKLLKAADKISALIKCVEEENSGNREFSKAKISILQSIEEMHLPEADTFIREFLPSYGLTIDELN
ncbi:MAG: 5'-deoxynucleotidase [Oscillospiraceae bacterium]|nr:5'-deoxynucleotidase [Oscillospiraceae bacterium]MBQ2861300.1 5'-deoxynucleotidase [Oscillospiraceae bacterium]MBQ2998022.1 5'-deoxynucleotidase [Oscillospiraceae bacterium]MBQ3237230.1 5'-deoxynucleotidase [Oscillospiraceae bacterium]MBQ3560387.1 5'-deoxynucleotidase [Oscillospiraceae bacterium]